MTNLLPHNIVSPEHKRDPFPFYASQRAEEFASQVSFRGGRAWLITRYEDVVSCLENGNVFVREPANAGLPHSKRMPWWIPSGLTSLARSMASLDNPEHLRLRRFVNAAFQHQRILEMNVRLVRIADRLLDALSKTRHPDIMVDFALPFPFMAMCEMLGLPSKDWKRLHACSRAFAATPQRFRLLRALPSLLTFIRYVQGCLKSRRRSPQRDLMSDIVGTDSLGNTLSNDEAVAMVILLMIAGHETTANLVGSGLLEILRNPAIVSAVRGDQTLMAGAVEELMRFTAPVEIAAERYVARETVLHGIELKRGEVVLPVIASANRDERYLADPDRLDIRRNPSANISFGRGTHQCIGFHLAKLEGGIAFSLIFERFPNIRLACRPEELRWRSTPIVRGLASLPVVLN
jgi:cytochrome P450